MSRYLEKAFQTEQIGKRSLCPHSEKMYNFLQNRRLSQFRTQSTSGMKSIKVKQWSHSYLLHSNCKVFSFVRLASYCIHSSLMITTSQSMSSNCPVTMKRLQF